ncbi:MAG: hypothetical protein GY915_03885 [bacterium]|nr:hypothetical protein [bacterium]
MLYRLIFMIFMGFFCSHASGSFFTPEELEQAALNTVNASQLSLEPTEEESERMLFVGTGKHTYDKRQIVDEPVMYLIKMRFERGRSCWFGQLALYRDTEDNRQNLHVRYSDILGALWLSMIDFYYYPRSSSRDPYVELSKSRAGYGESGKGYSQYCTQKLLEFSKNHTQSKYIISDARSPISRHIFKEKFNFTSGHLQTYTKNMQVPFYLDIREE